MEFAHYHQLREKANETSMSRLALTLQTLASKWMDHGIGGVGVVKNLDGNGALTHPDVAWEGKNV